MSFPYAAVIFDMDGLIFDTEPLYRAAWKRAATECGYELTDSIYLRLIGRGRAGSERVLGTEFGSGFSAEKFRRECKKAECEILAGTAAQEKTGFRELLSYLESQSVRKALATSTDRSVAELLLSKASLRDRFGAIIAGDDVRHAKPAPDLYFAAAKELEVEPEQCLVLEDSAPGVQAANRAGMDVFVVPDQIPATPEVIATASGVFKSLLEVKAHLESAQAAASHS